MWNVTVAGFGYLRWIWEWNVGEAKYAGKTKPILSLLDVGDGSVDLESFSDSFATFWTQVVARKAAKSKVMQILAVRERIPGGYKRAPIATGYINLLDRFESLVGRQSFCHCLAAVGAQLIRAETAKESRKHETSR